MPLYRHPEASGAPNRLVPATEGVGMLRQGYLEESGVDVVQEISELIEAQRGYELNSKVISAADEMLAACLTVEKAVASENFADYDKAIGKIDQLCTQCHMGRR